LVVVDVQQRLVETIAEHEAVVHSIVALVKAAEVLRLPVLATEQENLGETVPDIKTLLHNDATRKLSFSSCDSLEFMTNLNAARRKTVIICGIEAHICVLQTVLDLIQNRYSVVVVSDATSSHSVGDRDAAIRRSEASGAVITTCEAIIYELSERAGTDEFRSILQIVKLRRASLEQLESKH
jgi:nicotinamidase-related amidase